MTTGELLRLSGLHLRFRLFEGISHVLKGVSLTVNRGERVAIVGESGCGKSVTARLILGLLAQPNVRVSGSISFKGEELVGARPERLRRLRGREITMIFQDPSASLNPVFTIGDQLLAVIRRGGVVSSARAARRVAREALSSVYIEDPDRVLGSYPFQLSGGMNQRVLITMALANQPDLILADEPGTALDVSVQQQTLRLMKELTGETGAAVLLITHNLGVVREFADRVYVMYAGQVVEEADVESLFTAPHHPYTQALLKAVPRLTGGGLPEGIEGSVPDYTRPPDGCRFHPRCPHARPECLLDPPVITVGHEHRVACVLYDEEGADAA